MQCFSKYLVLMARHSPGREQGNPLDCEEPYVLQRRAQVRGLLMIAWELHRCFSCRCSTVCKSCMCESCSRAYGDIMPCRCARPCGEL